MLKANCAQKISVLKDMRWGNIRINCKYLNTQMEMCVPITVVETSDRT